VQTRVFWFVLGAALAALVLFLVYQVPFVHDRLEWRLDAVPPELARHRLTLAADGLELVYNYDTKGERTGITALLDDLSRLNIRFKDLNTTQTSLEDIFVDLVRQGQ